jgi:hypothetical protein
MPEAQSPNRPGPASALRFATEIVAWIATPWALWHHSWILAVGSVVLLVGLPTVFATPGDKSKVLVPAPGYVTIALVVLQMVAAAVSAWFAWPLPLAIAVWALVGVSAVTEVPRWRWLMAAG